MKEKIDKKKSDKTEKKTKYFSNEDINWDQYILSWTRLSRRPFLIHTAVFLTAFFILWAMVNKADPWMSVHRTLSWTLVIFIILYLKVSMRRWNDINFSWFFIISEILIFPIFFLLFKRWTVWTNSYWADPLYEKNNIIAKSWRCPLCNNEIIKILEKWVNLNICPNFHGFVDKKKNWVPKNHSTYLKNKFLWYLNYQYEDMPEHLQWILYLESNNKK